MFLGECPVDYVCQSHGMVELDIGSWTPAADTLPPQIRCTPARSWHSSIAAFFQREPPEGDGNANGESGDTFSSLGDVVRSLQRYISGPSPLERQGTGSTYSSTSINLDQFCAATARSRDCGLRTDGDTLLPVQGTFSALLLDDDAHLVSAGVAGLEAFAGDELLCTSAAVSSGRLQLDDHPEHTCIPDEVVTLTRKTDITLTVTFDSAISTTLNGYLLWSFLELPIKL